MGRLVYRGKEEFLGILLTILNDGGGWGSQENNGSLELEGIFGKREEVKNTSGQRSPRESGSEAGMGRVHALNIQKARYAHLNLIK